jgi:hypothetical protein
MLTQHASARPINSAAWPPVKKLALHRGPPGQSARPLAPAPARGSFSNRPRTFICPLQHHHHPPNLHQRTLAPTASANFLPIPPKPPSTNFISNMPRQRGGAAPVRPRPTVPAAKPAPQRQHSTAAAPARAPPAGAPAAGAPAAAGSQGPGLFGQMASTAA